MRYTRLSILAGLVSLLSASIGLFYSFGRKTRSVQNIYGQTVTLFGDGIYKNDSMFKVSINKGTDLALIFMALILIYLIVFLKNKPYASFLQVGLLSAILYATTCLIWDLHLIVYF